MFNAALAAALTYQALAQGFRTDIPIDPNGKAATFTCDAAGNRAQETSRTVRRTVNGVLTAFTTSRLLDANGRVTAETDALGGITRTEYNGLGKPTRTIDALGRITTYEYDSRGNLVRTAFPDGQSEAIGYDAEGNETSRTDARGSTTANTGTVFAVVEFPQFSGRSL
jgi:YD repeat-containing protein